MNEDINNGRVILQFGVCNRCSGYGTFTGIGPGPASCIFLKLRNQKQPKCIECGGALEL